MIVVLIWLLIGAGVWFWHLPDRLDGMEKLGRDSPLSTLRPHWVPFIMALGTIIHFAIWVPLWPVAVYRMWK